MPGAVDEGREPETRPRASGGDSQTAVLSGPPGVVPGVVPPVTHDCTYGGTVFGTVAVQHAARHHAARGAGGAASPKKRTAGEHDS